MPADIHGVTPREKIRGVLRYYLTALDDQTYGDGEDEQGELEELLGDIDLDVDKLMSIVANMPDSDVCADCGESTAIGTPDPHICGGGES